MTYEFSSPFGVDGSHTYVSYQLWWQTENGNQKRHKSIIDVNTRSIHGTYTLSHHDIFARMLKSCFGCSVFACNLRDENICIADVNWIEWKRSCFAGSMSRSKNLKSLHRHVTKCNVFHAAIYHSWLYVPLGRRCKRDSERMNNACARTNIWKGVVLNEVRINHWFPSCIVLSPTDCRIFFVCSAYSICTSHRLHLKHFSGVFTLLTLLPCSLKWQFFFSSLHIIPEWMNAFCTENYSQSAFLFFFSIMHCIYLRPGRVLFVYIFKNNFHVFLSPRLRCRRLDGNYF